MSLYVDNINCYSVFGIGVEDSSGVLQSPKLKSAIEKSWEDEHGLDLQLTISDIFFSERDFDLKLFVKGNNQTEILNRLNAFSGLLQKPGLREVRINNRVHLCVAREGMKIKSITNKEKAVKFSVKLTEPNPAFLQVVADVTSSFSFPVTVKAGKNIEVFWGDLKSSKVLEGASLPSHNYTTNGRKFITILRPENILNIDLSSNSITDIYGANFMKSITDIDVTGNSLPSDVVDNLLIALANSGVDSGTLAIITGNAARTDFSQWAYSQLILRSWTIS